MSHCWAKRVFLRYLLLLILFVQDVSSSKKTSEWIPRRCKQYFEIQLPNFGPSRSILKGSNVLAFVNFECSIIMQNFTKVLRADLKNIAFGCHICLKNASFWARYEFSLRHLLILPSLILYDIYLFQFHLFIVSH